jgi:valyl-tRNA synthetase
MTTLKGHYDFKTAEPRLQAIWAEMGIHQFDPQRGGRPYTVDTPPPTVSGLIHVGHVYSYTHADIMIRYHRMKGEQVFYPFGFDDNGLPTELFTERVKGVRAGEVGRQVFIEACLSLSRDAEVRFERFWKRLGLSVDWRLCYSTIDPRSRRLSQAAFLDLYEKGYAYRQEAPTLWCPKCRTGVAQAEVDDKAGVNAAFTEIPFTLEDGSEISIATTRPELLAACVALIVHPTDDRYRPLIGGTALTPMFGVRVPIVGDQRADPEKGTGAVMCCTFGDVTDVAWCRTHEFPLRIAVTKEGRMNDLARAYAGMPIRQARAKILEDLGAAGLIRGQSQIEHTVGVHERCGTEIEYLLAYQWFIRLLENKDWFLSAGRRINWHPKHMRGRYENWIQGLNWDWNITRQRRYGVPFPVWYCRRCAKPAVATREQLPVDPQDTTPSISACPSCGSSEFDPDPDVMDTWATSSITPQICGTLLESFGISEEEFAHRYRPMTLRPNAHDIIRTWDFYTIVRSLYLTGDIPWTDVLISGHALDPEGKKISKSKLKAAEDPTPMLDQFSSDAVRYWTASVRTGSDTVISEDVFRNGNRLITKLWNAAKFALPYLDGYRPSAALPAALSSTDRWLLARLYEVIQRATKAIEDYEFAAARAEVERFFWTDLCDNYLELVKFRLYGDAEGASVSDAQREAAVYTLYHSLLSVLQMLAPFMPHITEELYLAGFCATGEAPSIHISSWPAGQDIWASAEAVRAGQVILQITDAVRRWKGERQISVGAPFAVLYINCSSELRDALENIMTDLRSATRARAIQLAPAIKDGTLRVSIKRETERPTEVFVVMS